MDLGGRCFTKILKSMWTQIEAMKSFPSISSMQSFPSISNHLDIKLSYLTRRLALSLERPLRFNLCRRGYMQVNIQEQDANKVKETR